jgi:ribose 1,5-bisphosphokinase PhnN
MAGKTFKGGMDSLLGASRNLTKKRGRPKVNTREITKTSQAGTKLGETRATFIMNEDQLEKVKALAYWDRVSIKDILSQAIDAYLTKRKADLTKAVNAYKGRG